MQIIKLDISRFDVPETLCAKQGDVGRCFQVVLMDGGEDYPIPEGAWLSAWYSGTSGSGNYSAVGESSAFSVVGNTVTVELIAQMLQNRGGGTLCLMLNGAGGSQLGLWNIPYVVEGVPGMDSSAATQYYTAFSETASLAAASAARAEAAAEKLVIDETLSQEGQPADAAAVGTALAKKAQAGYGYGDTIKCYNWTEDEAAFDAELNAIYNAMPDDCVKQILCVDSSISLSLCACALTKASSTQGVLSGVNVRGNRVQKVFDGSWQPWEWVNPPMEIGVEYRTTERYTGKAVYTMLLDCGAVPGAGAEKQIRHEIFNINLVLRCTGTLSSGNTLPLDREGYGTIACMATPTEIILRAGADNASLSSWLSAHIQIWYTKN